MMLLNSDWQGVHLSADSWNCDRQFQSEDNINTSIYSTQAFQERDIELICNIHIYQYVGPLTHHNKSQYSGWHISDY